MCDTQLAQTRRQLAAFQLSMIQMAKIRTLAQSQRAAPPKRQKLNESVSISIGAGNEDTFQRMDIVTWPEGFEVMTRTWAVCGSFEVLKTMDSTEKVLMCEFYQAESYRYEFVFKISDYRERYTDGSIVKGLSRVEEAFRSKAIELTRSGAKTP